MTYEPRPKSSNDTLVESRDQIRSNFEILQSRFELNHQGLDAGTGKHTFLQMPEQASAPTTAGNEGALYTKEGTNPAETNLFFRAESDGYEYQITKSISASTAKFANNTNYNTTNNGGWCFLPGGLVVQYGRKTSPGSSGTVLFPITFPSGNAPFSIIVTNERDSERSANINNSGITSSKFNYFMETGGSIAINWIAIGN